MSGAPESGLKEIVVVTPEMMAAGVARARAIPDHFWVEYKVEQIYRAMEDVRRDPAMADVYARIARRISSPSF
jgi:hypothetical protein